MVIWLLTGVHGLSSQQKLIRGLMRNSGKVLLGLVPLLTPEAVGWAEERSGAGSWRELRPSEGQWSQWVEGWLRWSAQPLMVLCAGDHVPVPCSRSWHLGSGSWVLAFLYLVLICPSWACMHLVLVACSFFVFCYLKKRFVWYEHCSFKRSGSQPVSIWVVKIHPRENI